MKKLSILFGFVLIAFMAQAANAEMAEVHTQKVDVDSSNGLLIKNARQEKAKNSTQVIEVKHSNGLIIINVRNINKVNKQK